jgi:hypothetical protein
LVTFLEYINKYSINKQDMDIIYQEIIPSICMQKTYFDQKINGLLKQIYQKIREILSQEKINIDLHEKCLKIMEQNITTCMPNYLDY